MAKCCGSTGSCNCRIVAGRNIKVTGLGTAQEPLEIASDIVIATEDTASFDVGLIGAGTLESPWTISVDWNEDGGLDSLPDVDASNPSNGHTLKYDSTTHRWYTGPAQTAAPGAITTDASLSGDGSAGAPLQVREEAARYVGTTVNGLGLTDAGINRLMRMFADTATRNTTSIPPEGGTISQRADNLGVLEYWTGTTWAPIKTQVQANVQGTALLQVSGAYVAGSRVTVYTKNISVTTGAGGEFTAIPSADLGGYAGVLSAHVQPTGTTPWVPMLAAGTNTVNGVAWGLGGLVRANAPITARVHAIFY